MEDLLAKYEDKLIRAGLARTAGKDRPIIGGMDDELVWNRDAEEIPFLAPIFQSMAINSLVCFKPAPPYDPIIRYLAHEAVQSQSAIQPLDCETRTFLHDLPVVNELQPQTLLPMLKKRKSVIAAPPGQSPMIIAHGTVSPEQGFVTASSVLFACFVKFFSDYLFVLQQGNVPPKMHQVFDAVRDQVDIAPPALPRLIPGPFKAEAQVYQAMIQAGEKTVEYGLVDSYFGNISYCRNQVLYISQTGSSLDELAGCIDPVPLDHSSSAGLTASSELTAHMETINRTNAQAILHGHPKFSVILSMDCKPEDKACCRFSTQCHTHCPKARTIVGVPIVPGEVGTGPTGLCHTLPKAFETSASVIVYGHGLFTLGETDFSTAFERLQSTETQCRQHYFGQVDRLR